jgi:hypothetical protein
MDENKGQDMQHHKGDLGMNTPPIVSPEAWEAARQKMLVKEKAHMRAGDALIFCSRTMVSALACATNAMVAIAVSGIMRELVRMFFFLRLESRGASEGACAQRYSRGRLSRNAAWRKRRRLLKSGSRRLFGVANKLQPC